MSFNVQPKWIFHAQDNEQNELRLDKGAMTPKSFAIIVIKEFQQIFPFLNKLV